MPPKPTPKIVAGMVALLRAVMAIALAALRAARWKVRLFPVSCSTRVWIVGQLDITVRVQASSRIAAGCCTLHHSKRTPKRPLAAAAESHPRNFLRRLFQEPLTIRW